MPLNFEVEKYKYGTSIFVETGTFRGDGVNKALTLGYDKIYSIELDKKRYKPLAQKFEDDDEVTLIQGNSEKEFPKLMDKINKIIYDLKTDIDNNTSKYIIILGVLFVISIIL